MLTVAEIVLIATGGALCLIVGLILCCKKICCTRKDVLLRENSLSSSDQQNVNAIEMASAQERALRALVRVRGARAEDAAAAAATAPSVATLAPNRVEIVFPQEVPVYDGPNN